MHFLKVVLAWLAFFLESAFTSGISESFSLPVVNTYVEIDGLSYGKFQGATKVETLMEESQRGIGYLTLSREFVTERSIYLWAKNVADSRPNKSKIYLIQKLNGGRELARYELGRSKPLSWAVRASGATIGGFYEKVELAVQKVVLL